MNADFIDVGSTIELISHPWLQKAMAVNANTFLTALHLLFILDEIKGDKNSFFKISILKLAKKINADRTTISKILTRMENERLIDRDLSPSNNKLKVKILWDAESRLYPSKKNNSENSNLRSLKIEADKEKDTVLPIGIGAGHENK